MVVANLANMAQNQLLEIARGSPWHAAMLRMCGAQVERGVFLDSLLLLVRRCSRLSHWASHWIPCPANVNWWSVLVDRHPTTAGCR